MDEYVKSSIEARRNAIFNTYEVTDAGLRKEIEDLFLEIEALGKSSKDVSEFETKFAASPLNQKYMDIFAKLAETTAASNVTEGLAKQAATGAIENVARDAINNVVPTSRAAVNQKVYDAARNIPGVGEALDIKQHVDFLKSLKRKK